MNVIRIDFTAMDLTPKKLNVVFNGTTGTYYIHMPLRKKSFCAL